MQTIQSLTVRGERSDRTRIHFEGTISTWKPSASDQDLDDAIAIYVGQLSLGGSARRPRIPRLYEYQHQDDEDDRYSYSSRSSSVREPTVYPGTYTGQRKAIEYYPKPEIESRVSISSRRSRRKDDEMSIWPEDSASQVSTKAWTEPRGRTRRREGSVSTVKGSRMGGGGYRGGSSVIHEDGEYEQQPRVPYVVKDITPYVAGRR